MDMISAILGLITGLITVMVIIVALACLLNISDKLDKIYALLKDKN